VEDRPRAPATRDELGVRGVARSPRRHPSAADGHRVARPRRGEMGGRRGQARARARTGARSTHEGGGSDRPAGRRIVRAERGRGGLPRRPRWRANASRCARTARGRVRRRGGDRDGPPSHARAAARRGACAAHARSSVRPGEDGREQLDVHVDRGASRGAHVRAARAASPRAGCIAAAPRPAGGPGSSPGSAVAVWSGRT